MNRHVLAGGDGSSAAYPLDEHPEEMSADEELIVSIVACAVPPDADLTVLMLAAFRAELLSLTAVASP